MAAWNGWYHLIANTYGTWLPGDERGFRTRHHREHVQGDYKHPPPDGKYAQRHDRARAMTKRAAVILPCEAREPAARAIVHAMMTVHQLEVLALCVSATHLHVLVRLPAARTPASRSCAGQTPTALRGGPRERDPARYYLGIAKERSAKALAAQGLAGAGGVWARRGKIRPVCDRSHQVNVVRYILDHFEEGAAVWCFKEPDKVRMKTPTA